MLPLRRIIPARAYARLQEQGEATLNAATQLRAAIQSGPVHPAIMLDMIDVARTALAEVPPLAATVGLGDYIRDQFKEPDLDLTVALQNGLATLAGLVGAIVAEYPRDPETGVMLDRTLRPDGAVVWTMLDPAALPQTAAALDAYIAILLPPPPG